MADQNGGVFNNPHSYSVNSYSEVAKVDKRVVALVDVVQHVVDTTSSAADASSVNFIPSATIISTNVQDAIDEIDSSSMYGPIISTTNAIALFDDSSGLALKDSTVVVSAAGDVSSNSLSLVKGAIPTDADAGKVKIYAKASDGLIYVRNESGVESQLGGGGNHTSWLFSILTTGVPASTYFRLDNATPASATELVISIDNAAGQSMRPLLQQLNMGDSIYVCNATNTNCKLWTIASSTDNTTYFTVLITLVSETSAANYADNEQIGFTLSVSGNPFDQSLNTTDSPTFASLTSTGEITGTPRITALGGSPTFLMKDTAAKDPASVIGIISFTDNLNNLAGELAVASGALYITKPVGDVRVVADSMIVGCPIVMGTNSITTTTAPTSTDELTNKQYCDGKLAKSGGTMTGAIVMGTNSITTTTAPASGTTLTNRDYVDGKLAKSGGTMTGAIVMGTNSITTTTAPASGTTLTNRDYVDSLIAGLASTSDIDGGLWVFDTTLGTPPSRYFSFNQIVSASVTVINVAYIDKNSNSQAYVLSKISQDDKITTKINGTGLNVKVWNITAPPVDNGTYYTYTVTLESETIVGNYNLNQPIDLDFTIPSQFANQLLDQQNNVQFNSAIVTNGLVLNETNTPYEPSGTEKTLFAKSDGDLYMRNSAGLEIKINNLQNSSTGLLTGGVLSIGTTNTTFTISSGEGQIITDDPLNTTAIIYKPIVWAALVDIPVDNIATQYQTFVSIDTNGGVVQQSSRPSPMERRNQIFIGVIVNLNNGTVNSVNNEQDYSVAPISQFRDLTSSLGHLNLGPNTLSSTSGMTIRKSYGEMFAPGSNYIDNPHSPHVRPLPLIDTSISGDLRYLASDGIIQLPSVNINTLFYESPLGNLATLSPGQYTSQRIYSLPNNELRIQWGQGVYTSFDDAVADMLNDNFITEASLAANGVLIGNLIVGEGTTDLGAAIISGDAAFYEVGKFGGVYIPPPPQVSQVAPILQEVYDASTPAANITTTDASGLEIQRGSASDGDSVLSVLNGAGTKTFEVDGLGKIVASDTQVSNLTIVNTIPQIFLRDSNNDSLSASQELIMVDAWNSPCASLKYNSGTVSLTNNRPGGDINIDTTGEVVVSGDINITGNIINPGKSYVCAYIADNTSNTPLFVVNNWYPWYPNRLIVLPYSNDFVGGTGKVTYNGLTTKLFNVSIMLSCRGAASPSRECAFSIHKSSSVVLSSEQRAYMSSADPLIVRNISLSSIVELSTTQDISIGVKFTGLSQSVLITYATFTITEV
jgi:hypothetical protein